MDVSKNSCYGERQFISEMEEGYMVIYWEASIYLKYYKPHLPLKTVKKVVKSECFEKRLRWTAPFFLRNEGTHKVSSVEILTFR